MLNGRNEKNFISSKLYIKSPIIWLTCDFIIIEINSFALELYNWEKSDVLGKDYFKIYKELNLFCPFNKKVRSKSNLQAESKIAQTDGNEKFILWEMNDFRDEITLDEGLIIVGEDITKLKQEKDKSFQLDSVIAHLPGNVYWHDKDGIFLGCNDTSAEVLGIPRESVKGENAYYLLKKYAVAPEHVIQQVINDDKEIIKSGEPKFGIVYSPWRDAKGNSVNILTSKMPLFDKQGNTYGILGISIDISDRLKIENELLVAKEKADLANKEKNEFILNLSHDLLVPLYEILGMQDMALMAVEEAKVKLRMSNSSIEDLKSALSILINNIEESQMAAKNSSERLLELYQNSSGYLIKS